MDIDKLSKDDPEYIIEFIEDKKKFKLFTVSIETECVVLAENENQAKRIFWNEAASDMLREYEVDTSCTQLKNKVWENEFPWYSGEEYDKNKYVKYVVDNSMKANDIYEDLKSLEISLNDPNQLSLEGVST